MTAKLVRSTSEKRWSGKASPIRQAASRSAGVTCSTTAAARTPFQNASAASYPPRLSISIQVSSSTQSVVTSCSSVASRSIARPCA